LHQLRLNLMLHRRKAINEDDTECEKHFSAMLKMIRTASKQHRVYRAADKKTVYQQRKEEEEKEQQQQQQRQQELKQQQLQQDEKRILEETVQLSEQDVAEEREVEKLAMVIGCNEHEQKQQQSNVC